jgi:hypothetical protein
MRTTWSSAGRHKYDITYTIAFAFCVTANYGMVVVVFRQSLTDLDVANSIAWWRWIAGGIAVAMCAWPVLRTLARREGVFAHVLGIIGATLIHLAPIVALVWRLVSGYWTDVSAHDGAVEFLSTAGGLYCLTCVLLIVGTYGILFINSYIPQLTTRCSEDTARLAAIRSFMGKLTTGYVQVYVVGLIFLIYNVWSLLHGLPEKTQGLTIKTTAIWDAWLVLFILQGIGGYGYLGLTMVWNSLGLLPGQNGEKSS